MKTSSRLFIAFISCALCSNLIAASSSTSNPRLSPVTIQALTGKGVVQVHAGKGISYAVLEDGTVWGWGRNDYNQLGENGGGIVPRQIEGLDDVKTVRAGGDFTLALKNDGTVWALGRNNQGQLGDGTTVDRGVPGAVGALSGIVDISTESDFALALDSDGALWGWGNNSYGQLDVSSAAESKITAPIRINVADNTIVMMDAGESHCVALAADKTIWTWGSNKFGQLGTGDTNEYQYPVQVVIDDYKEGVLVQAGQYYSMAIAIIRKESATEDSTVLYSWGDNRSGQLGDGTTTESLSPVAIVTNSSLEGIIARNRTALDKLGGNIYGWGNNQYGQVYQGDDNQSTANVLTPSIINLGDLKSLSLSDTHALALTMDNGQSVVKSWGSNQYGQLGAGDLETKAFKCDIYEGGNWVEKDSLSYNARLPEDFNYDGLIEPGATTEFMIDAYDFIINAEAIENKNNSFKYQSADGELPEVKLTITRNKNYGIMSLKIKKGEFYETITSYKVIGVTMWVNKIGYTTSFNVDETTNWKLKPADDTSSIVNKFTGKFTRKDGVVDAKYSAKGVDLTQPGSDFKFDDVTPGFYVDGNSWETELGSSENWKQSGKTHSYNNKATVEKKTMKLNFKNGKWQFQISKTSENSRVGENGAISLGITLEGDSGSWQVVDTVINIDDGLTQKTKLKLLKGSN